jgi:hypothetical protein
MNFCIKIILSLLFATVYVANAGTIWDDGGYTYNWSEAGNWNNPNGIPGTGADVSFGNSGTYVDADISPTVGLITFSRQGNFIINGPGTITTNTGIAVSRNNRTYTINAPLSFGNDNTWTNLQARSTLDINGLVNTNGFDLTINNTGIINLDTAVVSTGALIKDGAGILNVNTYNQQFVSLTVNSGTLALDYKTMTLDGNVTLTGGILRVSVGSPTNNGQIVASGDISLGNGTTALSLSSAGYSALSTDQIWLMINDSSGMTTGYFSGLTEGSLVVVGGQNMYIRYGADYGTGNMFGGNDVMLCVPEPSTMILLALGSSVFLVKRRKSSSGRFKEQDKEVANKIYQLPAA